MRNLTSSVGLDKRMENECPQIDGLRESGHESGVPVANADPVPGLDVTESFPMQDEILKPGISKESQEVMWIESVKERVTYPSQSSRPMIRYLSRFALPDLSNADTATPAIPPAGVLTIHLIVRCK